MPSWVVFKRCRKCANDSAYCVSAPGAWQRARQGSQQALRSHRTEVLFVVGVTVLGFAGAAGFFEWLLDKKVRAAAAGDVSIACMGYSQQQCSAGDLLTSSCCCRVLLGRSRVLPPFVQQPT